MAKNLDPPDYMYGEYRYYIGNKIGHGTYGTVYEAFRDDGLIDPIAVKIFHRSGSMSSGDSVYNSPNSHSLSEGELREIATLRALSGSPGIVEYHELVFADEFTGVVLKRYPTDLYRALKRDKLTFDEKKSIAKGVLQAVDYIHRCGLIHRDLKCSNILLDDNNQPVITDFSLTKPFYGWENGVVNTSDVQTPTHRAPEVYAGKKYNQSIDDWSVGIILLEMFDKSYLERRTRLSVAKKCLSYQEIISSIIRGFLDNNPCSRLRCGEALKSTIFEKDDISICLWSPIPREIVSDAIIVETRKIAAVNPATEWAAQKYVDITGCEPKHAAILAAKIYENRLPQVENSYIDIERSLIISLDGNLFV